MKWYLFLLISFCAAGYTYAQEEIISDSIRVIHRSVDPGLSGVEKPLIIDEPFSMDEVNLIDKSMFHQPLLPDYSSNLDFLKQLKSSGITTESHFTSGIVSPFFDFGKVFNQAIYSLNNHFSFGGNSFGAHSIFDRPKINSSIQDMSIKGASMFIQYKVSDKFKIQTRVSITNHPSPWGQ